jgi:serine/threonine protein kinase
VAGLRHANLVQVHDVGDHDDRPYFTMEFIEGGSLAQKVAGTPQKTYVRRIGCGSRPITSTPPPH